MSFYLDNLTKSKFSLKLTLNRKTNPATANKLIIVKYKSGLFVLYNPYYEVTHFPIERGNLLFWLRNNEDKCKWLFIIQLCFHITEIFKHFRKQHWGFTCIVFSSVVSLNLSTNNSLSCIRIHFWIPQIFV